MSILVVAAHPDDEVLGCGGTIAREAGTHDVHLLILGEGASARHESRRSSRNERAGLERDARGAAKLLGASSIQFERLPDNRFDAIPLLDIVKRIEREVKRLKPRVIYTHHPGDLNIDHVRTARAVMTATRPMNGCPVKELYAFEVPSSTEWAFQRFEAFRPNEFRDISSTLKTKVAAMERYRSERRAFPHPRSPEALEASAKRWGSVVGVAYAEPFELIRALR